MNTTSPRVSSSRRRPRPRLVGVTVTSLVLLLGTVAAAQPAGPDPVPAAAAPTAPAEAAAAAPSPAPAAAAAPADPDAAPAGAGAAAPTGAAAQPAPGAAGSPAPAADPAAVSRVKCGPGQTSHSATVSTALYDPRTDCYVHEGNYWTPPNASVSGSGSDVMYYACLGLSAFFFFGITGCVVFFVIRYRHRPGHRAEPSSSHNDTLEITWTIIPTLICVFLFIGGWRSYLELTTAPKQALEINVQARKWEWSFIHPDGTSDNMLHVPVNTPVRLVMTSTDVLHSFFVPAFRVKQDLVPRRYTYAWFQATTPGTYRLYCAEYCGKEHSMMKRLVVVHPKGGYEQYLAEAGTGGGDPVEVGAKLYSRKGCAACHSTDGSTRVGPTFKGAFGSQVQLSDGSTVTADENYLRRSILQPQAQLHAGFPPSMPAFEGQLKEDELLGLIEYIKSLK